MEQRNQTDRRRDRGSVVAQYSTTMMPGSVGLTKGCMPYQDPVYSQLKKLPGTHFHNAACSPLRKLISLCRRCTMMLSALYLSHFAFFVLCFSLLFPSVSLPSHISITPYLLSLFLFQFTLLFLAFFQLLPLTSVMPIFQEHVVTQVWLQQVKCDYWHNNKISHSSTYKVHSVYRPV